MENELKLFTDTVLPGSHFTREDTKWPAGWMALSDWEKLLNQRDDRLSERDYKILLTSIRTNLPIVIGLHDVGGRIRKEVANVEYLTCHDGDDRMKSANQIRINYWGFNHPVWFSEIVSIETPGREWIEK